MLIAEAGINHNGEILNVKKLIDMASMAGCDVIKFQKRNPDMCVPDDEKDKLKDTPWGVMTYLEYKHRIELGIDEYDFIDSYCKEKNIQWTASVWDLDSVDFIASYNVPFIKIPSAKLTDHELLASVCVLHVPIVISTGMSSEDEIEDAVELIEAFGNHLTIMHCNSSYPAADDELNLNYIKVLREKYPYHQIGYSGHEEGISASLIAAHLGADVIERHITLSRTMWGTDQAASIVYDQLYRLARDLKKIDIWLGDGIKKVYISELPSLRKLRGK